MSSERSKRSSSASGQSGTRHVVFWVGQRCLSLSIEVVREVVDLRQLTSVPMAPPAVLGIISLRGTILSVVDAEYVLSGTHRAGVIGRVLVLVRDSAVVAALAIDRVLGVVALPEGGFLHNHAATADPFVLGHHDLGPTGLVAVLDPSALFHHVDSQRFAASLERSVVPLE
jgi:purine-binding chemotaxis protein CheW